MTAPLTVDHVQALKHFPHTFVAISTMLKRAADEMKELKPTGTSSFLAMVSASTSSCQPQAGRDDSRRALT